MRERSSRPIVVCLAAGIAVTALIALTMTAAVAQVSPPLTKWVDALPIPPVATSVGTFDDGVHGVAPLYDISINQHKQVFHRDLPPTTVQGYDAWTPGPLVIARRNQPIYMRFTNNLTRLMYGEDNSLAIDVLPRMVGRTAIHLHGGHVEAPFDGGPMDYFGPATSYVYYYPNDQRSTLLWFHDHAMGVTRTNVYAGMAGGYILRDNHEDNLNLPGPAGVYELPLVIQDRLFDAAGKMLYPGMDAPPMSFSPEFAGDTMIVNGKVWPFVNVEPRKYRLRIINGCNARFLNLKMPAGGPVFNVIGSEGGLLPATSVQSEMLVAPAERPDVIIDFSAFAGQKLLLSNNARMPFPSGDPVDANTSRILQFRVGTVVTTPDTTVVPANPRPVDLINPANADVIRNLTLDEGVDKWGRLIQKINKTPFMEPATEICNEGDTEVWRFINTTMDTHPMHIHLVNFQIVDRQTYDVPLFMSTGIISFIGPPTAPAPDETGWKDTVRANPGEIIRVAMHFEKTDDHRYTGSYVYHCHILEHEEHDMMRPLVVNPTP